MRNEMAALERDGYLQQPHTSAGRVPTEKGYRFFVDNLVPPDLQPADAEQVRDFFDRAHGEIERMLGQTSGLLSNLTDCAAVVVGPAYDASLVRSIQLVALTERVVLVVVVLANGVVEKHTVELAGPIGEERRGCGHRPPVRPRSRDGRHPALGAAADRRRRGRRAWSPRPWTLMAATTRSTTPSTSSSTALRGWLRRSTRSRRCGRCSASSSSSSSWSPCSAT